MAVEDTLARVRADLDAGRTELARQRLRGLVGTYPTRLDLRATLAALYRAEGDPAQAGRYDYLADDPDPVEVAAFERAYGDDPIALMRALGWYADEADAPTEAARERLAALRARAEERAGAPLDWRDPRVPPPRQHWAWSVVVFVVFCAALFAVGLVVAGLVELAAKGLEVVSGWF
ncbi:MAG TPA: DUF6584 family protein [Frankiaceae bacterium]|nr:DUF6584 family protein [Frankiaceae bacterium]